MKSEDFYFTVGKTDVALIKEKGSKFFAYAYEVENEENIAEVLRILAKEHPKSRHICYAWKLGQDNNLFKTWDDNEPSGTAGRPIMGQIEKFNLTNIIVAVVRYFGGTLLGTSGLIKAYKGSAELVLTEAKFVKRYNTSMIRIISNFAIYNKVEQAIAHLNLNVRNRALSNRAEIDISVLDSQKKETILSLKSFISNVYKTEITPDTEFENYKIIEM